MLRTTLHKEEEGTPLEERLQLKLATQACHNSIRAGDRLSHFRMNELLEELDDVDFGVCAHGRPVAIRIENRELEKEISSELTCLF